MMPPIHLPLDRMGLAVGEVNEMNLVDTDNSADNETSALLTTADGVIFVTCVDELLHRVDTVRASLEHIISVNPDVHICFACNKVDQAVDEAVHADLQDRVMAILKEFGAIEHCHEVSALQCTGVSDVIYTAARMMAHPLGPLYNEATDDITPALGRALEHVFRMGDFDGDGRWSDAELNRFQEFTVGQALPQEEMAAIKELIANNDPDGIADDTITLSGFRTLQLLLLRMNQPENVWQILSAFGFGPNLDLSSTYLRLGHFMVLARHAHRFQGDKQTALKLLDIHGCDPMMVTEISQQGRGWLEQAFDAIAVDGVAGPEPVAAFLGPSPVDHLATIRPAPYTKEEWIATWRALALLRPEDALRALHYAQYGTEVGTGRPTTIDTAHQALTAHRRRSRSLEGRTAFHVVLVADFAIAALVHPEFGIDRDTPVLSTMGEDLVVITTVTPDELSGARCRAPGQHNIYNADAIMVAVDGDDVETAATVAEVGKATRTAVVAVTVGPLGAARAPLEAAVVPHLGEVEGDQVAFLAETVAHLRQGDRRGITRKEAVGVGIGVGVTAGVVGAALVGLAAVGGLALIAGAGRRR